MRLCGTYFQSAFRLFSVRGRKGQECSARRDRHGNLSIGKLTARVNCGEMITKERESEFNAAGGCGELLTGHLPGFVDGHISRARRFTLHTPDYFSDLRTKQVVFAVFGGGELFHAVHRSIEPLNGFNPQRSSNGIILEDVVCDLVLQDTSPVGYELRDFKTRLRNRYCQALKSCGEGRENGAEEGAPWSGTENRFPAGFQLTLFSMRQ